jgi:putative phage-type endonuclease
MQPLDWLAFRNTGIGGSDIAAAMGVSPWKSPLQLYEEKTSEPVIRPDTAKTRAGKALENVVAAWYQEERPYSLSRSNFIWFEKTATYNRIANIDRVIHTPDGPGILEIKTTGAFNASAWNEQVPDDVFLQLQWYLSISGYRFGHVAVLIGGWDFRIFEIPSDKEMQAEMISAAEAFWQRIIDKNPPPPQTEADLRSINCVPNSPKTADAIRFNQIIRLREVRADLKTLEAEEDKLTSDLKCYLADCDTLITSDGKVLATYKQAKDSVSFDKDAFTSEFPELAQKFIISKPGSRRFLLKG